MKKPQGRKNDQNKLRMDLIPAAALYELSRVLTFGASKYGDNNWKQGISHSRIYAACIRHLLAYKSGETKDRESGISHLSHALCNIAFLIWMADNRPDLEDLIE